MLGECLNNVRSISPLIHNITNYVTANIVANAILACGAKAIMSDEPNEAHEITSISNALNINLGTLNTNSIKSMIIAGHKANEINNIVVLDPVGVGSSNLRNNTAKQILENIRLDAIRGNASEIKTLITNKKSNCGVDVDVEDELNKNILEDIIFNIKSFAKTYNTIVVVTGKIDIVSNCNTCYIIKNGKPEMSKVSGTGCMLSGILSSFLAANIDNKLEAAAAAVCTIGLAGEIAHNNMNLKDGNATYCSKIIDALYNLDAYSLDNGAKYEIR